MLQEANALDLLDRLLAEARKAGASAADALLSISESRGVTLRKGALEDASQSDTQDIGLRVFVGARSAQVATSDLSPASLAAVAARAVAMARVAPEDPYAGLADPALLAAGPLPALDLFDPAVAALPPPALRDLAAAAEAAALAVPGVTDSEGASASAGASLYALATSTGFRGSRLGSSVSISASVIAGTGDGRQGDHDWAQARYLEDLDAAETVGKLAGTRAVARLDPRSLETQAMPVLFDSRVAASLLGHLVAAMSGPAIARRTSFLLDLAGAQVFAPHIEIRDDPWRPRGIASRAFDGEGLPTQPRALVAGGRLGDWLLDSASARQLGSLPTGHASRGVGGTPGVTVSNLHLAAGGESVADLMRDIGKGLYVTELIGMGVNGLTGDYSRGAAGFAIRDGALAEPVTELTIAGNLRDMFAALRPADDLVFRRAINSPTVRIDGLMVAGRG
jgi:PmbA protein